MGRSQRDQKKKKILAKQLFEDHDSIGRIVNAVAMNQRLEDGSVKKETLVGELLNFKKGITVEVIEKEKVSELSNDISETVSGVEKACGTNGEKCKFDKGAEGIVALESVGGIDGNYNEILQTGSSLEVTGSIQRFARENESLKSSLVELITDVGTLKAGFKGTDLEQETITSRIQSNVAKISNMLSVFKKFDEKKVEMSVLRGDIDSILKLDAIVQAFAQNKVDVGGWSQAISNLESALKTLGITFTDQIQKAIKRKQELLMGIVDEPNAAMGSKTETTGFPNGLSDLSRLSDDLDRPFVAKIIGVKDNRLKDLIPRSLQMEKDLRPVWEIKEKIDPLEVLESSDNVMESYEAAQKEIKTMNSLQPLFACSRSLAGFGDKNIIFQEWKTAKTQLNSNEQEMTVFFGKLKTVSGVKMDAFYRLQAVFSDKKKFADKVADLFKFSEFDAVHTELTQLQTQVTDLITQGVSTWADTREIGKLISGTSQIIQQMNITSISACTTDKTMLANSKKVLGKHTSLSNTLKFNSGNKDVFVVSSAANLVNPIVTGIKGVLAEKKTKRAANKRPILKDSDNVNRKYNGALNMYRSGVMTRTLKPEIERLLSKKKEIQLALSTKIYTTVKTEYDTLKSPEFWTKVEYSHLSIPQFLDKPVERPQQLEDYSNFFTMSFEVKDRINLNFGPLIDYLVHIKSAYPSHSDDKKLRELIWKFENAMSVATEGKECYKLIVSFLREVADESNPNWANDKLDGSSGTKEEKISGLAKGLIATVGVLVIISAGLGSVLGYKYYKERQARKQLPANSDVVVVSGTPQLIIKDTIKPHTYPDANLLAKEEPERPKEKKVKVSKLKAEEIDYLNRSIELKREQEKLSEIVARRKKNAPAFFMRFVSPDQVVHMGALPYPEAVLSEHQRQIRHVTVDFDITEYKTGAGKTIYGKPGEDAPPAQENPAPEPEQITEEARRSLRELSNRVIARNAERADEIQRDEELNEEFGRTVNEMRAQEDEREGGRENAAGDEREARPPRLYNSYVEQVNLTGRQMIDKKGTSVDTNVTEQQCAEDHSEDYYPATHLPIVNERLHLPNFISGMMSEKLQTVPRFPDNRDSKKKKNYHVPVSHVLNLIDQATEVFNSEGPIVRANREYVHVSGDIHGQFQDFSQQLNPVFFDDAA
uniref:WSN domain-containing protein n=1 Tax=Caenorhabditis tropicalis TaxID=1561998 RepID=A0A1I7UAB3_9PELO